MTSSDQFSYVRLFLLPKVVTCKVVEERLLTLMITPEPFHLLQTGYEVCQCMLSDCVSHCDTLDTGGAYEASVAFL